MKKIISPMNEENVTVSYQLACDDHLVTIETILSFHEKSVEFNFLIQYVH